MAADAADAAPTAPMDVDPPPSAPEPPAASIDRAVLAARRRRSEMVQQCLPHHNAKIITRFIRLHVAWKRGLELIRREASSDDDSGDDSDDNASSAPDRTARLVRLELPHGPSNSDIAVAAHTMSLRTRRTDTRTPRRIPVATSLLGDIRNCATFTWDSTLYPIQEECLITIFDPKMKTNGHVGIYLRTGEGKTLVMQVSGTMLKGVHLIFHPLLALTGDVVVRFMSGNEDFGAIVVVNLDLVATTSAVRSDLMKWLENLSLRTTTTVFIFSSPQYLATHDNFRDGLIKLAEKRMLRSVQIDEVHIWGEHGSTFRPEIRFLAKHFFLPVQVLPGARCRFPTPHIEESQAADI